ncbi:YaeQ family protein [Luteimonas sp. SJ-92]|uniref:YaeQ family protein n=1 Tax=Luteimonas salinisoli TaxID=2752307 RepID=A0A853JAM7_9GAMM|nr:YaeQ family protein [Luteimonas salinisoli]NZA25822.1 YaeQ family protein [Luteimonas salinisoli]
MAANATVVKAELQVSDMDRHYYATHNLTLAQHPSETDLRLMVRLVAFALYADDRLEFGRGLGDEDEPALYRRAYTGETELWIDIGQPDETRIKKASARAGQVVVINYGGRASDIWWEKIGSALTRLKNLTVLALPEDAIEALPEIGERGMRLNALIQDRELQLMGDRGSVAMRPVERMVPR